MDRDPNSLTDDVATLATTIASLLDPEHFWPLDDTSATAGADSGFADKDVTLSGTPGRRQSIGYGLYGTRFDGSDDFGSIASAARASSDTFTILALFRPIRLTGADTNQSILSTEAGTTPGFYFNVDAQKMYFLPGTGYDTSEDLPQLPWRELALVGVRVEDGAATFLQNGVAYPGGDGTNDTIVSFTPSRVGGNSASTNRLSGDLAMVVYLPEVAISDADFAQIWASRFSCHTATLAVINRALAHLGHSIALTNLSTDTTAAGVQARLHYPTAVESVLRGFSWPFAKRYETLTLVDGTTSDHANSDWIYSYRAPDRMLRALRVVKPGQQLQFDPTPPPFALAQDNVGTLIFSNQEDAELEFLVRPFCPALQGDVLFREALSWYLAALFVPTLSKNERTVNDCLAMYAGKLLQAQAAVANEGVPQDQTGHDPDWIRIR